MDYETALKIELHFARREEKAYRNSGDAVNAERWHMVGEAFQRSLDLFGQHKHERDGIQVLDKHVGEWERQPHPTAATSFGKGAWARTVTITEGYLGDTPPDKDKDDASG